MVLRLEVKNVINIFVALLMVVTLWWVTLEGVLLQNFTCRCWVSLEEYRRRVSLADFKNLEGVTLPGCPEPWWVTLAVCHLLISDPWILILSIFVSRFRTVVVMFFFARLVGLSWELWVPACFVRIMNQFKIFVIRSWCCCHQHSLTPHNPKSFYSYFRMTIFMLLSILIFY